MKYIYAALANFKDEDVFVDSEKTRRSKEEILPSTQVVGSESSGTSCFISTVESPASQYQNERIQMQELYVQKVVYSERRKKRSQLTLSSSSSTSSPYLPRRDIEFGEETSLVINKEDIKIQVIDDYHDGDNKKQFACPYQLVNGPNNELIISDRDHHQLVVFDEKLQNSFMFGKMGHGKGTFFFPTGLALNVAESCLFVADHNNAIQKFKITYPDSSNKFPCLFEYIETYSRKESALKCPCGLAFSKKESKLFVCDNQNHRIQVFANHGTVTAIFGKRGDQNGEFNEPHSITINSDEDKLFITDHGNSRVQVFTPQGDFIQVIVDVTYAPNWPQLKYPRGIHCTCDGRLLVSSTHTNCVLEFDEHGTYKSTMEDIHQPSGIILHYTGDVIVTCTDPKRILVLKCNN